jgi:hypothetical protein
MTDFLGQDFLSFGLEIEFLQGAINKLIVTLGAKIPIGTTGLFITEMTGGVDDLASKKWKVLANVDIETGLELPVVGSPVKIDDLGALIQPWTYFKGSGSLEVFGQTVSEASIVYDHSLRALSAQCNMNLIGILQGEQKFSLQGGNISGSSMLSLQTPDDLPFGLFWAENIRIGSAMVEFHNYTMQSEVNLGLISLAQQLTFGKQSFPWFHYALGPNLRNLVQIWKGQKNGKQTITFEVPENASELMVVACDTTNPQLFDFSLISPSGKNFDSTNTAYQQFPAADQTVMVVKMPADGQWQFVTGYTGNVALYIASPDKKPIGMVNAPGTKQTLNNEISFSFNDYADTIRVEVYYDTDRKDFNGSFIDEFTVVNNANLTFDWQNEGIPDGEYFIYTRIDDGKNTPVLQYAPGSILIENTSAVEAPVILAVYWEADSVMLYFWVNPEQTDIFGTTIYYKDFSTGITESVSVAGTSETVYVVLKGLKIGHRYELWCRVMNNDGEYGPSSNPVVDFVLSGNSGNNPPYFLMDRDSAFIFTANESTTYTLQAGDADGNPLTFTLPGDTLGITVTGNQIVWTPTEAQKGVYKIMVVVSDGQAADTTWQKLIVYTPQDLEIGISFSSVRLYEQDNMFVTIRNYYCPDDEQTVTLTNLNSGVQSQVTCSRVNEFDYIGQFELTFTRSIAIAVANGDSLKASYTWGAKNFAAYAYYDSLPQPGDQTPPATIADLTVERLPGNNLKLLWTATGNDGTAGKAYRYDIRYSGLPITNQSVYLTANQILTLPYPAESGETDSLIINLANLTVNASADSVWFAIKASDEMQNWSGLSNTPGVIRLMEPANITAQLTDQVNITLDWDGPESTPPNTGGFQYYRLFRSVNGGALLPYRTGITQTTFTDLLRDYPDGTYLYALQAVYDAGVSDTVLANPFPLKRFVNVNILAELQWAAGNEGITVQLTGLDTIYNQFFSRITGNNGLTLIGNVFRSSYAIQLTKSGYDTITDTITVYSDPEELEYMLNWFVPATAIVQNVTLANGSDSCFEAQQTITVGGSGTQVLMQSGASANFIAGQKVLFRPTFKVLPGAYMQARIAPGGPWCNAYKDLPQEDVSVQARGLFFKVYPNPTACNFTLAFTRETESPVSNVLIYNLFGLLVSEHEVEGTAPAQLTLRDQPPGLYLVRVKNGAQSGTLKIVKQ